MTFDEIVKNEIVAVNEALAGFLDTKIEKAKKLFPLHIEFYTNLKEYMMRGGKRFRPIAIVTACRAVGSEVDQKSLYLVSCSIEILHNASLLHDDLIDHDETRRGGPTFHALYREGYKTDVAQDPEKASHFGMTAEILGGDSLINTGGMAIIDANLDSDIGIQCLYYYHIGFEEIIEGVFLEMNMVNDPNTTPEMYLEMIRLKTAALLEKSLLMGGAIARATDSQMKSLSDYGIKVGQAFQIQDDILGTFGDEEVTGKAADGDIKEGKKTMLLLEAQRLCTPEQKGILEKYLGNDNLTPAEVDKVREVFRESGALDSVRELMAKLLSVGQNALETAEPPFVEKYKQFMLDLSNFLVKRDY
ncbi:MAG: polyprenyl synthetase family protein [Candidatus Thorarchaeota archaeon]|nr:MAG: polyprenyl synthetase family protein [Candidatus Thorarchaeota archaeon]